MQKREQNLSSRINGNAIQPLAGVTVTVINDATGLPAALYSDNGVTPLVGSIVTDDTGYYSYHAANGEYTETFSSVRFSTPPTRKVILEDPDDNPNAKLSHLAAINGAGLSGYRATGTATVATDVAKKLNERKSIFDFVNNVDLSLAISSGSYNSTTRATMLAAVNAAWTSALTNAHDLFFPAGRYELGEYSFPWRQSVLGGSLLDCQNVTIHGEGPSTVFATVSSGGADVFQLNGVKNLHFAKLKITASLTAVLGSGSNAISVTGGYDNLTFDAIHIDNCQGIDRTTFIDGGKGLTLQCDGATFEVGKLKAKIYVKGCSQGFGFEAGLTNFLTKKVSVDVDVIAEDCFVGATIGAPAATGAIPAGTQTGVRVKLQSINCQKDVVLGRVHGVEVSAQVITTKTEAERRLDPRGVGWYAADTQVEALQCTYAKNSRIAITGNKGACSQKARIGGASAGSSGLTGATEYCDISLDVAGTASVASIVAVNSGGNVATSNRISMTPTTGSTYPADLMTATAANVLTIGQAFKGSFTGTLTGCTTAPTGTITWNIVGNMVTLNIPAFVGVSNTIDATITGMPAEIFPAANQFPQVLVQDSGVVGPGRILITTGGAMILNKLNSSSFTAAANKGIPEVTLTYQRF